MAFRIGRKYASHTYTESRSASGPLSPFANFAGVISTGTTVFLANDVVGASSTAAIQYPSIVPTRTAHLAITVVSNTLVAQPLVVTLLKNGVATAVTISVPAGVTGRFDVTAAAVYNGTSDNYDLSLVTQSSPGSAVVSATVQFLP